MNKNTNNNQYDKKRALAVEKVANQFGVSQAYVRIAIKPSKMKGINATEIEKRYNEIYALIAQALK